MLRSPLRSTSAVLSLLVLAVFGCARSVGAPQAPDSRHIGCYVVTAQVDSARRADARRVPAFWVERGDSSTTIDTVALDSAAPEPGFGVPQVRGAWQLRSASRPGKFWWTAADGRLELSLSDPFVSREYHLTFAPGSDTLGGSGTVASDDLQQQWLSLRAIRASCLGYVRRAT